MITKDQKRIAQVIIRLVIVMAVIYTLPLTGEMLIKAVTKVIKGMLAPALIIWALWPFKHYIEGWISLLDETQKDLIKITKKREKKIKLNEKDKENILGAYITAIITILMMLALLFMVVQK